MGSVPERVSAAFYGHGLFCSSHPIATIVGCIVTVLVCCAPLSHLPLPGQEPLVAPNGNESVAPWWLAQAPPGAVVLQVVVRSSVAPWTRDLRLSDAFRGPLALAFPLVEAVRNFHTANSSLQSQCLHVEGVRGGHNGPLPAYNCLLLSPAALWHNDASQFRDDPVLLNTIFSTQGLQKGKSSIFEMVFGMQMKDTGVKRYPLRTRQRVLQFAVTLVMAAHDPQYVEGLRQRLASLYPLHQSEITDSLTEPQHIFYPGEFRYGELAPLAFVYLCLFCYVYFSVRKMELVKSKFGIAFAAMATALASLSMSIGLCFFFGLTLSLSGRDVFPYTVVFVGLENVLVLTRSVVSTPAHLDTKIRLAQGLSREGWGIAKNLLLELTVLTAGLCTMQPAVQEFCIFAIVGLVCDFFLQTFFFSTVLAIDIRRMESSSQWDSRKSEPSQWEARRPLVSQSRGLARSKSHPRLAGERDESLASPRLSKRLRLVHFWASTRIFQRMFMVSMAVWISVIAYSSFPPETTRLGPVSSLVPDLPGKLAASTVPPREHAPSQASSSELGRLRHWGGGPRLPARHWPSLLALYNVSLAGRYVTLLPPLRISHAVSPDAARAERCPHEAPARQFQWRALAVALDPIDVAETGGVETAAPEAYVPSSPMELLLAGILVAVSVAVAGYALAVLYGCVCSRHYAEWRSGWRAEDSQGGGARQVVREAMPLALVAHAQDIECLATDGRLLASSDLSGLLVTWDAGSGDQIALIDRSSFFASQIGATTTPPPPAAAPVWPDLSAAINTNFSARVRERPAADCVCAEPERRGFDFGTRYRRFFTDDARGRVDAGTAPPVWCLDVFDGLVAIGCADGRLEFWEGTTGTFKCQFDDGCGSGVTSVRVVGNRAVAARLSGALDFLELEACRSGRPVDWGFGSHRRTHVRSGSAGAAHTWDKMADLRCTRLSALRAHAQPITALDTVGGRVLTGSQDHTLKVFRLEDQLALHTLHGHCGPITCVVIDRAAPLTAASGSQDGLLCVWDLLTGACVYSVAAHDGAVLSLSCSASYLISAGADERLCVWERFQGHLLGSAQLAQSHCAATAMLGHSLLVTAKQGSLVVWDVRSCEPVRVVELGRGDACVFVRQLLLLGDGVACDFGNQLRVVRFPMVADKTE